MKSVLVYKCPFFKISRKFTIRFCDNLISGVPQCVVWDFYPDFCPFTDFESVSDYDRYIDSIVICSHFVRSDIYEARFTKSECFFGGSCFYPLKRGFSACSVGCSRFKGCSVAKGAKAT